MHLFPIYLQDLQYKQTSSVDQLAIHFALDGNLIHKDSDEARRQLARGEQGVEGELLGIIYFSSTYIL